MTTHTVDASKEKNVSNFRIFFEKKVNRAQIHDSPKNHHRESKQAATSPEQDPMALGGVARREATIAEGG